MVKENQENKKGFKDLKLFPLITGAVSLLVMILLCALPRGFGETLNIFLVPAVAVSFILLGIYLIRNLEKWLNLVGIAAIVFGVIAYPIMVRSLVYDAMGAGFFNYLVMQFVPFNNGTICVWELLNFVLDGFTITANLAALFNAAMSTTLYVGILIYLFFPASKILKDKQQIADKDSALRFYICMFSAITAVLVLLILIIWGVCALFSKMLGGSQETTQKSSAKTDTIAEQKQVIVDGIGAVCLEIRERGEVYNVRTSNEFIGYYRDSRIYDEKLNEIGFIGPNNEICYLDANKKGKFGEFSSLYLKDLDK